MPADSQDEGKPDNRTNWLDVPPFDFELPSGDLLVGLSTELENAIDGASPDPEQIEASLSEISVPDVGSLDVETAVRPDTVVSEANADAIVDAGGQAVDVAIDSSGEGAKVLVDTGGEVLEVAAKNGGKEAAEATAEVLVAALDGL